MTQGVHEWAEPWHPCRDVGCSGAVAAFDGRERLLFAGLTSRPLTDMGLFQRWFGSKSEREEQRRAERAVYRQRLLSPRWDVVEVALGRPVPAVLRELYADQALVTSDDLLVFDPARSEAEVCLNVNQFIPADESALAPDLVGIPPGAFAFATNEFGDPIYVKLGELPDGDGRIVVHHHDGDDTEEVAPSLRALLSWPRAPRLTRDLAV